MKKIIILILCLFTLTGCYNYIELSELGVVSSLLIDYDEGYQIKIEMYDDKKVKVIKGNGKTINEALENAKSSTDREIYYQHMNSVFVTKNVNLHDIIYYLIRNPNITNSFYLVYTTDDNIYKDEDENVGKMVRDHLEKINSYSFFDVMNYYINKNKDLYLPIYKNKKINGVISLKESKFKTKYDSYEEGTIKLLNNIPGNEVYAKCDNEYFLINVDKVKTDIKVEDKIKIKLYIQGDIKEYTCKGDTSKIEVITNIQNIANKKLERDVNKIIDSIKEDKTDLLGINTLVKNKYHKLDKKFYQYDYEIEVDTHVYKKGLLLK